MSYGQFDEDSFILSQFTQSFGYAIEVGGADGINGSPTKCLEDRGWKTLLVEANPQLYAKAKAVRPYVFNCAAGEVCEDGVEMKVYTLTGGNQTAISGLQPDKRLVDNHLSLIESEETISVNKRSLNVLIYEWEKLLGEEIGNIDFLSIDTEGTEMNVVSGLNWNRWKPKMVQIENNFEDPYYGIKMWNYGYVLWNRIGVNDFYLHQDYVPKNELGFNDLTQSPYVKR